MPFDFKSIMEKYLSPENIAMVENIITMVKTFVVSRVDLTLGKYKVTIYKVAVKSETQHAPLIRIDITE